TFSSRLEVKGAGATSATTSFRVADSADNTNFLVRDDGRVGIGTSSLSGKLNITSLSGSVEPLVLKNSAASDTNVTLLKLTRNRDGSTDPNLGFAGNISFQLEGADGNDPDVASINWGWERDQDNDTTDRDSYLSFHTMLNGADEGTSGTE